jgi:hypothetical protein
MAAQSLCYLGGFLAQVGQSLPERVAVLPGPDHQRMTFRVADQHRSLAILHLQACCKGVCWQRQKAEGHKGHRPEVKQWPAVDDDLHRSSGLSNSTS